MTGQGHLIIGLSVSTAITSQVVSLASAQGAIAVAVGTVAALLPDIDAEWSIAKVSIAANNKPRIAWKIFNRRSQKELITGIIYQIFAGVEVALRALLTGIMDFIHKRFGHRTFTHYLITDMVLTLIILALAVIFNFSPLYALTFFVGYLSHLLGDCCTVAGLTMFKPYSNKTIHILPKKYLIRMEKTITITEFLILSLVVGICTLVVLFL